MQDRSLMHTMTAELYRAMYEQSVKDPEAFWGNLAQDLVWMHPWSRVKNTSFTGDIGINWFDGAKLNLTESCIDRHAAASPDKIAILWEGNESDQVRRITYAQLLQEVCRLSNALKELGVRKGDRVTIYMPQVPEAVFAMLACARIGAVHSVVFAGFSPEALLRRIADCGSDFVITANEGVRGSKRFALKANVDAAIAGLSIRHVLVYSRTDTEVPMTSGRDVYMHNVVPQQPDVCPAEPMAAEDPLFILYTSGSTGKPKGMLHTTAGYLVYAAVTTKFVFDLQPGDVYWCTADVGWITGHSYIVYGPLANGVTTLLFEGIPTYPDAARYRQIIDRHGVTQFYTSPTAIRSLMQLGDSWMQADSPSALRIVGSVGEPLNIDAWHWLYEIVGESRCAFVDTWWQTETGGHMLVTLPGAAEAKPGWCGLPFFGVRPELYDPDGRALTGEAEGLLGITDAWPGMARTVWGDHERFKSYFAVVEGVYFTADGAKRDASGNYRITGRVDDVINVSGHRLATAEIEAALTAHEAVAEAAAVGYRHEIKGQGIYAYVVLKEGSLSVTAEELKPGVRRLIGALAVPDFVQIATGLPKTRSGKIMRRILRKIADNEPEDLGDTSTLLDPQAVEALVGARLNRG